MKCSAFIVHFPCLNVFQQLLKLVMQLAVLSISICTLNTSLFVLKYRHCTIIVIVLTIVICACSRIVMPQNLTIAQPYVKVTTISILIHWQCKRALYIVILINTHFKTKRKRQNKIWWIDYRRLQSSCNKQFKRKSI